MNEYERLHELYEARELLTELTRPQPTVIGIEGGPCGGKTTLAERLRDTSGRTVVVLPEAATQHILTLNARGIDIGYIEQHDRAAYLDFEAAVLKTIVENIDEAREVYAGTDTIIVADRCDIGAYVSDEEYAQVLTSLGRRLPPMLTEVDKLYYLPSVAQIDATEYDRLKASNPARYETAEVAQQVCRRNLHAVARHPELSVAWGGEFNEMIETLASSFLNPEQETELKLHPVHNQDIREILRREHAQPLSTHEITQSFHELDGVEFRLRHTSTERDESLYAFTIKTGQGLTRHEHQRRLSQAQYELLSQLPRTGGVIEKRREHYLVGESKKRVWTLDYHYDRRLPELVLEVAISNEQDAKEFMEQHARQLEVSTVDSRTLSRSLGTRAMRPELVVC